MREGDGGRHGPPRVHDRKRRVRQDEEIFSLADRVSKPPKSNFVIPLNVDKTPLLTGKSGGVTEPLFHIRDIPIWYRTAT